MLGGFWFVSSRLRNEITKGNKKMTPSNVKEEQKHLIETIVNEQMHLVKQTYAQKLVALESENKNLRADLLYLQNQHEQYREASISGNHTNTPHIRLSKEEYAQVLPARLEQASLKEVVEADCERLGLNIHNDAEWAAYLNPRENGPSLTQMAKRASA